MMKKEALLLTAITWFDKHDQCWITQSPLDETIIGAGDSETESIDLFYEAVDIHYNHYQAGKHALKKPGRPAKDGENVHMQIKAETRQKLNDIKAEKHFSSQGEVVDFLYKFYELQQTKILPAS
ncbi:MAG: hypothetical protein VKJ04_03850 [Vampirovibrionales bacterium]|nr:hypothetical protein [Vampirovibrionales bacterium]